MLLKEILRILEGDARQTPKQIAAMSGATADEVTRLIRQAEEDGTIIKYRTLIDWEKVGDEHVWALIEVKVTPQRTVGFDAIAERIYRFDEARTVYLVSGAYELAVLVSARNMREVADFVTQKLAAIEGVAGTTSHFLLKRYKEDGVILAGGAGESRQAVVL
ncbi:MAG: Lrp/AsnC family transcriptional regulator [Dehalococcoidia bacterium]|nr:Lrp/AsnC family transcriptional regulator [Dehalococcoidia bacterium]